MSKESNVMTVKQWRKRTAPAKKQEPYEDISKYGIRIGIDPGTNTGICIYWNGKLEHIETMAIHKAMDLVKGWCDPVQGRLVRFEDARLRTWYGEDKRGEKKKGAGSVERDCAIWQDFLKDIGVDYDRVHPKDVKATTPEQFKALTGYSGRTSIHAREAAWMVI